MRRCIICGKLEKGSVFESCCCIRCEKLMSDINAEIAAVMG